MRRLVLSIAVLLAGAGIASATPAVPPPTLTATSLPSAAQPVRAVTISWNTGSGVPGQLDIVGSDGKSAFAGYGNNGMTSVPGVQYGQPYRFSLHTVGLHDVVLANLLIEHGSAHTLIVARSWIPPQSPELVNRVLEVAPWFILAGLIVLIVGYLRSIGRAER